MEIQKSSLRIGTTSYILADDILPNVRYLAPLVDDIELVLFESQGEDNFPSRQVISELKTLASDFDLTYTIHFPLDVFPGSMLKSVRKKTLETYLQVIDLTTDLDPFGYILHLTPDQWATLPSTNIPLWQECLDESLGLLLARSGLEPTMFCAETLSYPFSYVLPLVEKYDLAVTLDIGHIWLMDYDDTQACSSLLPKTRVCHLHGVAEGKDHQSLEVGKPRDIGFFLDSLRAQDADGKKRVLTLEVFNEHDFSSSLALLAKDHGIMGKMGGLSNVRN
ncbi:cobamide remodeling phosphodiesterase CbiR [uncultured Sphaerochaeta sp.]|uniref:cobamide remodeling phosphodiesterase CbiR n=1 Tax=uncultured Sphaerochaeta sp. TaxID=886478 RepID=UPI002A0A2BE1|nr:cobamide remodeling phosphodiesterase CbiR [uncultured Sphaerochaeta sp.]